jgi:hypothetical protein
MPDTWTASAGARFDVTLDCGGVAVRQSPGLAHDPFRSVPPRRLFRRGP